MPSIPERLLHPRPLPPPAAGAVPHRRSRGAGAPSTRWPCYAPGHRDRPVRHPPGQLLELHTEGGPCHRYRSGYSILVPCHRRRLGLSRTDGREAPALLPRVALVMHRATGIGLSAVLRRPTRLRVVEAGPATPTGELAHSSSIASGDRSVIGRHDSDSTSLVSLVSIVSFSYVPFCDT
ncbi:hypothetical protein Pd630_LPD10078 (plasmid) [Rhodococcus opacus PD630]|nr:hypothetical protein Pd630_LPD10078 [Rhodococcus opacus PD630]